MDTGTLSHRNFGCHTKILGHKSKNKWDYTNLKSFFIAKKTERKGGFHSEKYLQACVWQGFLENSWNSTMEKSVWWKTAHRVMLSIINLRRKEIQIRCQKCLRPSRMLLHPQVRRWQLQAEMGRTENPCTAPVQTWEPGWGFWWNQTQNYHMLITSNDTGTLNSRSTVQWNCLSMDKRREEQHIYTHYNIIQP